LGVDVILEIELGRPVKMVGREEWPTPQKSVNRPFGQNYFPHFGQSDGNIVHFEKLVLTHDLAMFYVVKRTLCPSSLFYANKSSSSFRLSITELPK
jgi:hypothetical protein